MNRAGVSDLSNVADSWEDHVDELSSDTDAETSISKPTTADTHHGYRSITGAKLPIPNAPPPTPVVPRTGDYAWSALPGSKPWSSQMAAMSSQNSSTSPQRETWGTKRDSEKRPEKTNAAAGRIIAAGLGLRAPKKTMEERKYERAMKEAEIRKQNREWELRKREVAEEEKAKSAVWDG